MHLKVNKFIVSRVANCCEQLARLEAESNSTDSDEVAIRGIMEQGEKILIEAENKLLPLMQRLRELEN